MLEIVVSLVFGEVLHKEYVTPGMVRIVFGGEELTAFETTGTGDEYLPDCYEYAKGASRPSPGIKQLPVARSNSVDCGGARIRNPQVLSV